MLNRILLVIPLFLVFLSACDNSRIVEYEQTIPEDKWIATDTAIFEFSVEDTITPCNILFSLKNTDKYRYNNIWFFVTTIMPDNTEFKDTIDYILQNPRGNWFGLSLGDVYGRYLPYRIARPLPLKGKYTVKVCHAMRNDALEGIKTIGFRIEHSKLNNQPKQK